MSGGTRLLTTASPLRFMKIPPTVSSPRSKAIPALRDRFQSDLLLVAGVPLLCWVAWEALHYAGSAGHWGRVFLVTGCGISSLFGLAAWRIRAATAGAAACGALICFDITILSGRPGNGSVFSSGLTPLILLFLLTHAATRFRRDQKKGFSSSDEEKHGRAAAQVIANLGVAALASAQYYWSFHGVPEPSATQSVFAMLQIPMLSALAEATADTLSSEIGQAAGQTPYLLLHWQRVSPGTDGAISAAGTLAGIAGAGAIALISVPAMGIGLPGIEVIVLAAVTGLFFDSVLGATLERGGWIGNDVVNFASSLFSAALAYVLEDWIVR